MRQGLTRLIAASILLAVTATVALPQPGLAGRHGVEAEFTDVTETLRFGPQTQFLAATLRARPSEIRFVRNASAPCDKLSVDKTALWFATDADGNVDTETTVDSYARDTTVIAPGFHYDCAPKDTEIVAIIYNQAYGSEPALVDKRALQASAGAGEFFYALTTPDNTPLQEGKWRVAFYEGKTPLSTGEILLGGSADVDTAKQAVVQGTVIDLRSGQPVWQARIFVLNPGVTVEDFARNTRREDIYAQTRTDAQGQFSLWKPLERNTAYAMLIAADGYKLRGTNRLFIGDQAASPVSLDIKLVKK
jgi:hypothetical protein